MDHCLERASYLGPCVSEHEALLLCRAADPPVDSEDCDKPLGPCEGELDALLACVYPAGPCEGGTCSPGQGAGTPTLQCDVACAGAVYTWACNKSSKTQGFPMDCVCQIDGEPVGACQNVTGDGSHGLSCCSVYFAESE